VATNVRDEFRGYIALLTDWRAQLLILLMTSGYMWNQIRTPPFLMPGANGQVSYIAAGYQNQYGIETQIVATICARHLCAL
jgi:hypothetical protein